MPSLSFTQYDSVRSTLPEKVYVDGEFQTNGASPAIVRGKGYSVAQVSTGVYRITFNKRVAHIVSISGLLVKATTSARFLEMVDDDDANNYVTFRVVDATGAAAAPGAVGDKISFQAAVMMTKLPVK